MNLTSIIVLTILVSLIIVPLVIFEYNEKKTKKIIKRQIINDYGNNNCDEFRDKTIIEYYNEKHESEIDEITKTDLEFFPMFKKVNNTYSSLGEEYLYYVLSNPVSQDTLKERERIINYFSSNDNTRIDTQYVCYKMGKLKNYSGFEALDFLLETETGNLKWHYINPCLLFISFIMLCIVPKIGFFMLLASILFNLITYFVGKTNENVIIESIKYASKIIASTKVLSKIIPENVFKFNNKEKVAIFNRRVLRKTGFMNTAVLSGTPTELLLDYIRVLTHFDYIIIDLILKKLKKNYNQIFIWASQIGYIESMIAVASFRKSLPYYTTPVFSDDKAFEIEDIYISIIDNPISNSINGKNNILLTGSNASGKSTFLKAIGLNAIFAETINTVMAKKYVMPFGKIISSMDISDSIEKNESYYVSEIKSLKRIIDSTNVMTICCIDEILRGTNTIERVALAAHILKYLSRENVLCFAATHDIELTDMLNCYYENYHFEEKVDKQGYEFDYKLKPGKSNTRNAITLLEYFKYPNEITENATKCTKLFEKNNSWKLEG